MAIYDAILKPCPRCAGEAHLEHNGQYCVACSNCDLLTYDFDSRWEAVKVWNTQKIHGGRKHDQKDNT